MSALLGTMTTPFALELVRAMIANERKALVGNHRHATDQVLAGLDAAVEVLLEQHLRPDEEQR